MLTYLQEASTLPSVYLTAIYSLYDLASTKKGYVSARIKLREVSLTLAACLDTFGHRRAWTCFDPALQTPRRRGK